MAVVALNLTIVVPVKPEPVRSTPIPTAPLDGEKLVILGAKLKLIVLVVVPVGVVTLISPPVAPVGTVVLIAVSEATLKLALTPLNLTAVAPVKLVPSMVTAVPTIPLVGKKLVILGRILIVKLLVLFTVPIGVVILIAPVVAPVGTVVVMEVSETILKAALTPLNLTLVVPVKLAPVMVTLAPTAPLVGEKLVIVGGKVTVKLLVLVAVPIGVVILICPLVAPVGTIAFIEVSDITEKVAATLLNLTAVAPVKLMPEMLTLVPIALLVGEKLVRVGGKLTVKLLILVAAPTSVVILIVPVVAPVGTVAIIEASELMLKTALTPLNLT